MAGTPITITSAGLNLIRDAMKGTQSGAITYIALGTSNTAPMANDTKLGLEVFRKAISSSTNGVAAGESLIAAIIATGEAVGVVIAEIGFFGGSTATGSANTGVLVAHGLYSHTKLNTETLNFTLDLTV